MAKIGGCSIKSPLVVKIQEYSTLFEAEIETLLKLQKNQKEVRDGLGNISEILDWGKFIFVKSDKNAKKQSMGELE